MSKEEQELFRQVEDIANALSEDEEELVELIGEEYKLLFSSLILSIIYSVMTGSIEILSRNILIIFGLGYRLGKGEEINLDPDIWGDIFDE